MNIFGVFLLIGVAIFAAYQIYGLVKDLIAKKKAKKGESNGNDGEEKKA